MANLVAATVANFRISVAVFIGVALAPASFAQTPRQLQVELGVNHEIRILASNVSYGEVLRALQEKMDWAIEIPAVADELKLSRIFVEAKQPQEALAKLLEGSTLGYAFLGGVNGSRILKVVVIPPSEGETTQDAVSNAPIRDKAGTETSPSLPTQVQAATSSDCPEKSSAMSLSEAINAVGVPPGMSPSDVGRMTTFPISDAAKIVGVSPGVSPADIGRMITVPISEAVTIIGVQPGVSPSDIGKTITLLLPPGSGKRP